MRENTRHLSLRGWIISLNTMISSSTHFPPNNTISLFLIAEENSVVYMFNISFIHSFVYRHVGWFHNLTILNSDAISMSIQEFAQEVDFNSFGLISEIVWLDHMKVLVLIFWGTSVLISTLTVYQLFMKHCRFFSLQK
jgi:hypothetical protein